ncbi:uncharacterized protein EV420DRAFT_431075 [Desarmillaria tabescens]|uniref:Uncharacterized protein n=1 Tax=Armillaria tabescens TaxID=1929756 RepID=A0AA39TVR1_ARMTA|nr:uncharacterized protein EV420DRAFT_431075 [Desarmillaria tabescens]KAK0467848.1 hypothetical protein EV420DRAFT_431075 [Desarmillaria tabescens]
MSADIPSSTMLFNSILTALYPTSTAVPASSISIPPPVTSIYSILPVLDSTTISTSSSSSPTLTSVHSMLSLSESSTSGLAPESQPSTIVYSILPVSDSIPTTESSTLAYSILPVLDASTPVVPTSTLVYSILPTSTTTAIISPTPTTASESLTSNFPLPSVTVAPAKDVYQSTSVPGAPITLAESRSSEAVDSSSSSLSSSASEPSSSSQRINNLALQPTADPGINSLPVTVITSGSITRTFVVRPTVGITGVGGAPGDGEARGLPSSGDTRSHPKALPIILGSVLGCAAMIGLLLFVVCRRRRLRRWHRLPEPSFRDVYEPALDASRHSSRFLNPFSDIDDDWSIIAPGDVERPVSATTTASTLAFAPSQGDGDDLDVSERWETRRTRWLTLSPPARW